jgi:hypothetical protein
MLQQQCGRLHPRPIARAHPCAPPTLPSRTPAPPPPPLPPLPRPDMPSSGELDEVLGPLPEVPSDELWWGEPDPKVYGPETNHLNK